MYLLLQPIASLPRRWTTWVLLALPALGSACLPSLEKGDDTSDPPSRDEDRDGYRVAVDCNDADDAIHPDAPERCDGVDNDCDGETDEEGTATWYWDADGDGYGRADTSTSACAPPVGYVESADDCDDTDANIRPNGSEECNGADDNCDGIRDGDGVCPCAFDTRDGHSYLFCDGALDKVTWVVASRSCAEHGYQLVKIGDANENAWILATADSLVRSRWWIGANDRVDEGAWVWEDGTTSCTTAVRA